jgi:hypothetical protein
MKYEEERDRRREAAVATLLAARWRCEWGQLGPYTPFDVYMMREKKIVSLVEIRTRTNRTRLEWSTVLLDLDKWFTLLQAEVGLGLPGIYAVAFQDGIGFVRIGTLPVNEYAISFQGPKNRPEAANDRCPVIEVPSKAFKMVCPLNGALDAL